MPRPDAGDVERAVHAALEGVIDPEIRRPITELDMVERVTATDAGVEVGVRLTIVGCPASDRIEQDVRAAAEQVVGAGNAVVELGVMTPAQRAALTERLRG
ncbi:metal-sulfur cluster assembly factor, partial [Agromyces binzhouensis]